MTQPPNDIASTREVFIPELANRVGERPTHDALCFGGKVSR